MGEWRVVRVPESAWWGKAADARELGVSDLPVALGRLGLEPGDPIYLTPDCDVDPRMLEFVRSRDFQSLERESKRNYATDYRLLLTFLSSRAVNWWEATPQDLHDYRNWRCDAPANPGRIGGDKWEREAAAFTRLFKWAKTKPMPVDISRKEDQAPDRVSTRVSWLTPRTWGLWQDIGLRGHTPAGASPLDWAGRTEARNTAFVQLLLSSGLRRQEGASLLTFELPTQRLRHGRYCHGQVAAATTRSKTSRTFYASIDAVGQVEAYIESDRAWAVERAQQKGRYDRLPIRLVTEVTTGRSPEVRWVDRNGVEGSQNLSLLKWDERRSLFLEGPEGPEPAWLWLTEQGLPMLPDRWENVFRGANQRCERVLLTAEERVLDRRFRIAEVRGKVPYATPHSTRHSFALYMLILLNQLMETRYGLSPAERRDFTLLFGDPWFLVKNLLGHADVETTKRHYLAPVTHLQLESILAVTEDPQDEGPEDLDSVFARLARESQGIQDIDALVSALPEVEE